jgi:hypothetical protein
MGKILDSVSVCAVKLHEPLLPVCPVHRGCDSFCFLHIAAVDLHQRQSLELLGTYFSRKIVQIPGVHLSFPVLLCFSQRFVIDQVNFHALVS